jgi:hypothetical protein
MRKLFWGCTAAGLSLAGGLFAMCYHAAHHPDSTLARCLVGASSVAVLVNPTTALPAILEQAQNYTTEESTPANQTERAAEVAAAGSDCIPADPVPVEEPCEQGIGKEAGEERMEPGEGPPAAPLVVHEDEGEVKPVKAEEEIEGQKVDRAEHLTPENQTGAALIPDRAPPMPYCEDEEPTATPCKAEEKCEAEKGCFFFFPTCEDDINCWLKFFGFIPEEKPAATEDKGECREDANRDVQYPGCPHTGCPSTGCPHGLSPCTPCVPARPGTQEPSEESKPVENEAPKTRLYQHSEDDEEGLHTDLDTMEFRPSDGTLYDYGPPTGPL